MRTVGKIVMAAALAAGLVACSSAGNGTPAGATASAPTDGPATATTLAACTVDDIAVTGAVGSKPTITVPDTCSPPTELLSKDLVVGTGLEVTEGVTMQTDGQGGNGIRPGETGRSPRPS
jgi:peptidylprolyl isomerase